MASFTNTVWTPTEATDWEAGDFFRFARFRDQFGQNIEYLKRAVDNVFKVNVKTYGALGDDVADDTTAIQSAINAAVAAGNAGVYFPEGTYKITAALNVDASNIRLHGDGARTIVKQYTALANVFNVGSAATQRSRVIIESLDIRAGVTKTGGAGIALQNCVYSRFANLNIDSQWRAADLYDKNFGVLFSQCVFTENKETGVRYTTTTTSPGTNGVFFENCIWDNPSGTQPTVAGVNWVNGEGLYALNCELIRQRVGLLLNPASGQACKWGFFTNVLFDLGSSHGCEVASAAGSSVYGLVFTNCWSSTNDRGFNLNPAAGTFDGLELVGCRVLNNAGHGLYIGQHCDHVSVVGGYYIANSRTTTNTTDGIFVENLVDALTIVGAVSKGAIWGYANNQRYGINFSGTGIDNTIVVGCDLRGNGTGAFNNLPTTGEHRILGNLGVPRNMPGGEASTYPEVASAPAAVVNAGLVFAMDDGAGATRLLARFGTGSDQQLAIQGGRTKRLFVPGHSMEPDGGVFANNFGSDGGRGPQLVSTALQGAFWNVQLPADARANQTPVFKLLYAADTTGGGTIRWDFRGWKVVPPAGMTTSGTNESTSAISSRTAGVVYEETLANATLASLSAGAYFGGNVMRDGADAADTYAGNVIILGLVVEYASDS